MNLFGVKKKLTHYRIPPSTTTEGIGVLRDHAFLYISIAFYKKILYIKPPGFSLRVGFKTLP
ncbi:MAG: hypothetical protein EBS19_07985 [Spirochaetia bacterium]|nr:hypothetical protein [Spirochaetia bacterium]